MHYNYQLWFLIKPSAAFNPSPPHSFFTILLLTNGTVSQPLIVILQLWKFFRATIIEQFNYIHLMWHDLRLSHLQLACHAQPLLLKRRYFFVVAGVTLTMFFTLNIFIHRNFYLRLQSLPSSWHFRVAKRVQVALLQISARLMRKS